MVFNCFIWFSITLCLIWHDLELHSIFIFSAFRVYCDTGENEIMYTCTPLEILKKEIRLIFSGTLCLEILSLCAKEPMIENYIVVGSLAE